MQRTRLKLIWGIVAGGILVAVMLRLFVWQPYVISSGSMEPTLRSGDRILVNRLASRYAAPARGDIVVFAYPKNPARTFVKRVIGLEGETVELRDNQVFINGRLLNEPYLHQGDYPPFGPQTVPAGSVFVLGDNRRESGDSRDWGLLPKSYIVGKPWLIYLPLTRLKFL